MPWLVWFEEKLVGNAVRRRLDSPDARRTVP